MEDYIPEEFRHTIALSDNLNNSSTVKTSSKCTSPPEEINQEFQKNQLLNAVMKGSNASLGCPPLKEESDKAIDTLTARVTANIIEDLLKNFPEEYHEQILNKLKETI